jgi:hypothetical protein
MRKSSLIIFSLLLDLYIPLVLNAKGRELLGSVRPSDGWVENANQIKSSRMRRVKYTLTVIRGPINGRRLHAACNMTCLMVSNNQGAAAQLISLFMRYAFPRT